MRDGRLMITREGKTSKFLEAMEQITFNGQVAVRNGQRVLYVTERCVFQLTPEGLELIEVAPDVDIERDILAQMAFCPIVRKPRLMDYRLFSPSPMGLEDALLHSDSGKCLALL